MKILLVAASLLILFHISYRLLSKDIRREMGQKYALLLNSLITGGTYNGMASLSDEEILDYYFQEDNIKMVHCGTIMAQVIATTNGMMGQAVDMSRFEDAGVIGIFYYRPQEDCLEDEDYSLMVIPEGKVYEMKDGSYHWDMRDYL